MDSFCGSEFWDLNITWYTADPDFTPCFQSTLLVWIPSIFLLLFSPLQIYAASKAARKKIPISLLGFFQHAVALSLVILQVSQYYIITWKIDPANKNEFPADTAEVSIKFATYILALSLQLFTKYKGTRSSTVLFLFWLLATVCSSFHFASAIRGNREYYKYDNQKVHQLFTRLASPLMVAELILHFFADNPRISSHDADKPDIKSHEPEQPIRREQCPEHFSSFPNRYTYQWMYSLLWTGYKRPLEFSDLWELDDGNKALPLFGRFNKHWKPRFDKARKWNCVNKEMCKVTSTDETEQGKSLKKTVSLFPSLWSVTWKTFVVSGIAKLCSDLLSFTSPQILSLLIAHVAIDSKEEQWKGFVYVGTLFAVITLQTIFHINHCQLDFVNGMRVQSILSEAVYRKSLLLSNAARQESTSGQIVNLMSVDAQIFKDYMIFLHNLWSGPLTFILSIYFLWKTLGTAALIGLSIFLVMSVAMTWFTNKSKVLRTKQMKTKDERMRLMNEMLAGIKVLKLYAWEPAFEKRIKDIRMQEISLLRRAGYLTSAMFFINFTTVSMVALVSFASYVLLDENNILNAQKVFVSLAYFNMMRRPTIILALAMSNTVQMKVSLDRLTKFMNAEEINSDNVTHERDDDGTVVRIDNGSFFWDTVKPDMILKNIDLKVKQGSLVAVVGIVGSGKSSLLSAVLGEMEKLSGKINTVGSIAYVSQQAWIQNATLRDNILFGKGFDPKLYNKVVEACALKPDFKILVGGDMTEIGENGINLSGGQKQRVALARAVYNQADIYLFDDPLSAVDAHVGQHIFKNIIGPQGLLRSKTRIVVTHGITYLPNVDKIIVLSNGEIRESGTFSELLNNKGAFAEFVGQHSNAEDSETNPDDDEALKLRDLNKIPMNSNEDKHNMEDLKTPLEEINTTKTSDLPKEGDSSKLIKAEVSEVGSIKSSVYAFLLRSMSGSLAVASISMYIISHGLNLYSNVRLADWANIPTVNGTQDVDQRNLYLSVYGGLTFGEVFTIFLGNLATTLGFLNAAKVMHNGMLAKVLRSPMAFFDTTPMGRIINKFSKDLDAPDNAFPYSTIIWLGAVFRTLVSLIGISINAPLFLVFVIPVGLVFFAFERFYERSSQQLKRLESVTKSPIFSKFGETLTGVTTIRAFKAQQQCLTEFEKDIDSNQMAYYPFVCSKTWFSIILETFGNSVVLFTSLFLLVSDTSDGSVGLSITYALTVTSNLGAVISQSITLQNSFVSVERIKEYFEIQQEAVWETPSKKPAIDWPQYGSVDFKNFQLRYREGLDLVLKNVDCRINTAEKIAVVGRTGAGKSSLTLGLFRIMEAAGGSVEIDGVNIADIGLHDVRGRLTIIPQDPVLFVGTLRINLDPHEQFADEKIWQALEYAHLKEFILSLPGGLEATVNENGSNFSVGQRQLVCLARALLRKTKILILDEATAAVDLETDDLIQQTIRSEFKNSTVLTIAHRLNTILDYDRIMVLDQGKIVEFDTPQVLLQNTDSMFFSMAREAKIV